MIVKTRYRDISWEEVAKLHPMMTPGGVEEWNNTRNREIVIETESRYKGECGSPTYDVVNPPLPDCAMYACEHIAEIGD